MRRLADSVKETINLGVMDGKDVVYLFKLACPHPFRVDVSEGTRASFHATALGKVIAAYLPHQRVEGLLRETRLKKYTPQTITTGERFRSEMYKIREQGYSTDNEEMVLGGRCLAAPIFNGRGDVAGALSVSGPARRIGHPPHPELVQALKETTRAISAKLGFMGPPHSD